MSDAASRTSAPMIRVALADDQRLLREGLRIILGSAPDLVLIGEAEDGAQAVVLAEREHPDVFLLDIRMPQLDGIEATRRIRATSPTTRVLLLTTYDLPELVIEGMQAGASGFMRKDASAEELTAAVRAVSRGQTVAQGQSVAHLLASMTSASPIPRSFVAPGAGERATQAPMARPTRDFGLTDRERDVLRLIVQGRANTEIADELVVSEATVKTHINHIFAKLGARDRSQAILLAQRHGLV